MKKQSIEVRAWALSAATALLLCQAEVRAAPVGPGDGIAVTDPAAIVPMAPASSSGPAIPLVLPPTTNGASKTLDLLIELQAGSKGLQPGQESASAPDRSKLKAALGALGEPKKSSPVNFLSKGLFGEANLPAPTSKSPSDTAQVDWSSTGGGMPGGSPYSDAPGGGGGSGGAGTGSPGERVPLLPRGLFEFIRENRKAVVAAAIGILALFWAGSAVLSRRR